MSKPIKLIFIVFTVLVFTAIGVGLTSQSSTCHEQALKMHWEPLNENVEYHFHIMEGEGIKYMKEESSHPCHEEWKRSYRDTSRRLGSTNVLAAGRLDFSNSWNFGLLGLGLSESVCDGTVLLPNHYCRCYKPSTPDGDVCKWKGEAKANPVSCASGDHPPYTWESGGNAGFYCAPPPPPPPTPPPPPFDYPSTCTPGAWMHCTHGTTISDLAFTSSTCYTEYECFRNEEAQPTPNYQFTDYSLGKAFGYKWRCCSDSSCSTGYFKWTSEGVCTTEKLSGCITNKVDGGSRCVLG